LDLLDNSDFERHPIGNQGSGKKIQVVEKEMRTGVPVTAYGNN